MISYGRQLIDDDDIDAVTRVLKSDFLTQGPVVQKFENSLKEYFEAKYCCVVSNGTAALHLASMVLDWKEGDVILTSPITFLASANCIIYSGATPDFVDINYSDFNIDINKLEEKILSYRKNGKNIKAVVAVDYSGYPCEWKELRYLANKFEFQLINDNCHSMGAKFNGDKAYAVKFADLVTQSYHPVKNFTSGEGGSVMTNYSEIDEKIRLLRSHGMTKGSKVSLKNNYPWYYEMHQVGFNYRLTDIHSALGMSQLSKLDKFVKKRQDIAMYYNKSFKEFKFFKIPKINQLNSHSFHLYPFLIDFDYFEKTRKGFFEFMKNQGILLQVHYIPLYKQPYYRDNFGFIERDFPNSEKFYSREVSLPIHPGLSTSDQDRIIDCIFKFFNVK